MCLIYTMPGRTQDKDQKKQDMSGEIRTSGNPSHAACKAHALYYTVICGLSDCIIFFPTLSHKRHDYRGGGQGEEVIEHKMCVMIFSTNFV